MGLMAMTASAAPATAQNYKLELRDVFIRREKKSGPRLLHDINLGLICGEVVAIRGKSGCGKTTLLKALNRFNELKIGFDREHGNILLDGVETKTIDPLELTNRVALVMQEPTMAPGSIFKNAAMLAKRLRFVEHHSRSAARWAQIRGISLPPSPLEQEVEKNLRLVELWDVVSHRLTENAATLSGGQRQRLAIARTLGAQPEVLLLDEPTSALDPALTRAIQKTLLQLSNDGVLVVYVTHEEDMVAFADRVITIDAGRVAENRTQTPDRDWLKAELAHAASPPGELVA